MKLLLFFLTFTVFAQSKFVGDFYTQNYTFIENPAANFYKNDFELNLRYNHEKYFDGYLGGEIFFLNSYFYYGANEENENQQYMFSASMPLSKYLGLGYSYLSNDIDNYHHFGVLIRNSFFYLGWSTDLNNSKSPYFQIGINPFDNIAVSFHTNRYENEKKDYEWNWRGTLTLLDLYGFDLSYSYGNDEKHFIQLGMNFPYNSIKTTTSTDKFTNVELSFYSQKERVSLFSKENNYFHLIIDKPFSEIGNGGIINGESYTFLNLLYAIYEGLHSNDVDGFFIEVDGEVLGLSQVEEIIGLFKKFNSKNEKKVILYLKRNNLAAYTLCSIADKVIIHPATELSIQGPYFVRLFYKRLLDFIGVDTYFFKKSEYKTAPEEYTNNEPSKYYLEELNDVKEVLAKWIRSNIVEKRKLIAFDYLIEEAPYSSVKAKDLNLVDEIDYVDFVKENLRKQNISLVSPKIYFNKFRNTLNYSSKDKIAVLTIDGIISENKSDGSFIGGSFSFRKETMNIIDTIKNDSSIDGVIIRINSPGGDGFVSDEIHRAVTLLKQSKKVYISMSSVAASGGYYIAVAGEKIFANKTTITGSIGVFSGQIVIKKLLSKLMIDIFSTSLWKNGSLLSMFEEPTPEQKNKMEEMVNNFYQIFLTRVKDGRKMSVEDAEKNAKGQIYLGEKAKEIKLVDETGGFYDVVETMKKDLSLTNVELIAYPQEKNLLKLMFGDEEQLLTSIKNYMNLLNSSYLLIMDLELK